MNIDQLSAPIIAGKPPSQETNPLLQGIHESGNNSKVSIADLTAVMQSQGLPSSAQSQIMTAVMGSQPPAGSTVDMASVLAKIQALEKEKVDLETQLQSSNTVLSKYREEKSVGMKDRYIKEMKDFIEGLQLRDPEVKKAMHDKMEALAHQGNETGVWEILACASSNHKANVNQIETLTTELNSYREKEKQLQGGLFRSESSRVSDHPSDAILGAKRGREELEVPTGHDIWSDFQDLVMKQGGNRGADYSQNAARFDASMIR